MLADAAARSRGRAAVPERAGRPSAHPLLGWQLADPAGGATFTTELGAATHWILAEHRIAGHPVVPGTTYLEMARAALAEHGHDGPVQIRDVYFLKPLRLREDESREVRLCLEPAADGFEVRVASRPAAGAPWEETMSGRIGPAAPEPPRRLDLAALIDRCRAGEVIAAVEEQWTEQLGPRWLSVRRVHLGDGELVGELELPEAFAGDLETFKLHPALLDRAASLGRTYLIDPELGFYLPMSYRSLKLLGPLPRRIYSYCRLREGDNRRKETLSFDVLLLAEDGTVIVDIEEYSKKKIHDTSEQLRALAAEEAPAPAMAAAAALEGDPEAVATAHGGGAGPAGDRFERTLRQGIAPAEGVEVLRRILARRPAPQVAISPTDLLAAVEEGAAATAEQLAGAAAAAPAGPRSWQARPDLGSPFVPPADGLETTLAGLWREILGIERIGAHDNYFELGGDSVLGIQIIARARREGLEITPNQLFEHQTIAELAAELRPASPEPGAMAVTAAPPEAPPPLLGAGRELPVPLSHAQERLWFLDRLDRSGALHNIYLRVRFEGDCDRRPSSVDRRAGAAARDPADHLRDGGLAAGAAHRAAGGAGVSPDRPPRPGGRGARRHRGPARRGAQGGAVRPRERAAAHRAAAAAGRAGAPAPAQPAPHRGGRLVDRRHRARGGGALRGVLPGSPVPPRGAAPAIRRLRLLAAALAAGRPPGAGARLLAPPALRIVSGAGSADSGAAASGPHLPGRRSDPDAARYAVGIPAHPRPRGRGIAVYDPARGVQGAAAPLPRPGGPLRRLAGGGPQPARARRAHRPLPEQPGAAHESQRRPALPGDSGPAPQDHPGGPGAPARTVREAPRGAASERDLSRTPLFRVFFNMFNFPLQEVRLPGLRLEMISSPALVAKFDLTLYVSERHGQIQVLWVYNADLFDAVQIERMAGHLRTLLAGVAADPDRSLLDLPLLTAAEREETVRPRGPGMPAAAPEAFPAAALGGSIGARFSAVAARFADRPAVAGPRGTWTYRELAARAAGVGRAILRLGGPLGEPVALLFGHGPEMVAGILGALLAGRAYVPLDPRYPRARLELLLADSGAAALVSDGLYAALARELADGRPVIEAGGEPASGRAVSWPEMPPEAPAYILYTSGSTGRPKGVLQSHGNVLRHIRNYVNALGLGPEDRLGLLSSYSFDGAVMDIFGALLSGAALCPLDLKADGRIDLAGWARESRITVYHSTPTVFRLLSHGLRAGEVLPDLRLVVLGGEEAKRSDFEAFRRLAPEGARFVNGLGPSESTLGLQYFLDRQSRLTRGSVPAGYPVEGLAVHLVQGGGEQVAVYGIGEIFLKDPRSLSVTGAAPSCTAAAFLPAGNGSRAYRTGDLGRLLPGGVIEFAGRKDLQVKIRGHRVELGEIEACLLELPGIAETAVVAFDEPGGSRALAAYVVPAAGMEVRPEALREALRSRLQDFLVPSVFVTVEALPRTPNGKLDGRALPRPAAPRGPEAERPRVAPRTGKELRLAEIWSGLPAPARSGCTKTFSLSAGTRSCSCSWWPRSARPSASTCHWPPSTRAPPSRSWRRSSSVARDIPCSRRGCASRGRSGGWRRRRWCRSSRTARDAVVLRPCRGRSPARLPRPGAGAGPRPAGARPPGPRARERGGAARPDRGHGRLLPRSHAQGAAPRPLPARRLLCRRPGGVRDGAPAPPGRGGAGASGHHRLPGRPGPPGRSRGGDDRGPGGLLLCRRAQHPYLARVAGACRAGALDGDDLEEFRRQSGEAAGRLGIATFRRLYRVFVANRRASWTYLPGTYDGKVLLFEPQSSSYQAEARDAALGWREVCTGDIERVVLPGGHVSLMREPQVSALARYLRDFLAPPPQQVFPQPDRIDAGGGR